jgi:predicted transcriptional regulator
MARSKDATRLKAESYYIENFEATQKDIAELFNVLQPTVSAWVRKYEWEEKRLNFHASPTKIKQLLQQELLNVASGGKPKLPADSISKLMAALDKCEKTSDPIVVHKILKDLDMFISQIDADFATKCTPFHKQFLQHRISLEN